MTTPGAGLNFRTSAILGRASHPDFGGRAHLPWRAVPGSHPDIGGRVSHPDFGGKGKIV
jgi:hypothetical protein